MKRYQSIGLILIGLMAVVAVGAYIKREPIREWWHNLNQEPVPVAVTYNDVTNGITDDSEADTEDTENANTNSVNPIHELGNTNTINTNEQPEPKEVVIPDQINLAVPFTSQAPHANWDLPYQEACEEASVLMAARFLQNRSIDSANDADTGILELVDYVTQTMDYPIDINAQQTADLIEEFYDLHAEVIYDWTWDDVKQALAQGYPVIAPAAGRMLGNPNFTSPGPLYHMMIIKGYTANRIITNDPGTRKGADYQYSYDTIMNASHDWNDGDVNNGKKVIIIVKP